MAKNTWDKHKSIEESIKILLKEGPMSINMITIKLEKVSYGLVKRRIESMREDDIVTQMPINHQVKFWQLA